MEVSAKGIKIWRKEIESKNGTFYRYSVGVSSKNQDGTYTNAYIDVLFSKKSGAPDKIPNGALCDFEGFMSAKSFTDKEGKTVNVPQIVVMSASFEGMDDEEDKLAQIDDSYEELEEDIPF